MRTGAGLRDDAALAGLRLAAAFFGVAFAFAGVAFAFDGDAFAFAGDLRAGDFLSNDVVVSDVRE
jgi:hypothetical protein